MPEVVDSDGLVEEAPGVIKREKPARPTTGSDARWKCTKCRSALAQVQNGNDRKCSACLRDALAGRLRHAMKTHDVLVHGDRLLVAYSGGACSRVLIHLLCQACTSDWSRPERGKVMFETHIVHVDESAASADPKVDEQYTEFIKLMKASLELAGCKSPLNVIRLEDVYGKDDSDALERRANLKTLMATVADVTTRQDLVAHLRQCALAMAAQRWGCNKTVLGDSASTLTAAFISAAAKGQGYAAPGSLQLADVREGPAGSCVIRPMREASTRELAFCAHFEQLIVCQQPSTLTPLGKISINRLASDFIDTLHIGNPGALGTVIKTVSKLQGFPFNNVALSPPPPLEHLVPRPSTWRHKRADDESQLRHDAVLAAAVPLCPLCRAPLHPSRVTQILDSLPGLPTSMGDAVDSVDTLERGRCFCPSCDDKLLGKQVLEGVESPFLEHAPEIILHRAGVLGRAVTTASRLADDHVSGADALRPLIAKFLLSDDD